jgi:general nucleoside transport system permease protein
MNAGRGPSPKMTWRFRRRTDTPFWLNLLIRLLAVILALVLVGIVIKLSGLEPIALGKKALVQTLGTSYGLQQAAVLATPLIMTGLAVALGMKMRLWNIGTDGQLYLGAFAASAVGLFIQGPPFLMIILMLLAGAAGGMIWILIPALLRAYWNVNEIITTLLLNFVAVLLVSHFAIGPWRDTGAAILSATRRIPYELPTFGESYLHIGIFIPLIIAILLAILMRNTQWGYEVRVIGSNRGAAEFTGMPVLRHILIILLISGAIAGISGMIIIAGTSHRLSGTISNSYGYMGIIVAALANGSPLGVLVSGALLAILLNAGIVLQTSGLSVSAMLAINGVILIFAAIGEVATKYRLVHEKIEVRVQTGTIESPNAQATSPESIERTGPTTPEKEMTE